MSASVFSVFSASASARSGRRALAAAFAAVLIKGDLGLTEVIVVGHELWFSEGGHDWRPARIDPRYLQATQQRYTQFGEAGPVEPPPTSDVHGPVTRIESESGLEAQFSG